MNNDMNASKTLCITYLAIFSSPFLKTKKHFNGASLLLNQIKQQIITNYAFSVLSSSSLEAVATPVQTPFSMMTAEPYSTA